MIKILDHKIHNVNFVTRNIYGDLTNFDLRHEQILSNFQTF